MTDVRLWIVVTPRAASPGVVGQRDGCLQVKVRSAPSDGRATEEALAIVASHFGMHRRDVALVTGATSRRKLVQITDPPEAVRRSVVEIAAHGGSQPPAT